MTGGNMLSLTLTVLALCVACIIVWVAARRSKALQRVSGQLSGPVEQMQEQILLTADSAVDRLDGKIAQMEILLAEIDRRSTLLAQQIKQLQMQQLQSEQQQQQAAIWFQTQRQQMEQEFSFRQQAWEKVQQLPIPQKQMLPVVDVLPIEVPGPQSLSQPAEPKLETKPKLKSDNARLKTVKSIRELETSVNQPALDKRTVILDMAEQGYSVTDIAQKMGIGKGEVMLLLKLRRKAVP
jgi:DNA-directed RNA polymerase specialized sigma24 family protein